MKKSLVFGMLATAALSILFLACKKKEDQTVIVKNTRGYNCENYTCVLVEENAQYVTLSDCKGDCSDKRPGTVSMRTGWGGNNTPKSVEMALAYSSSDLATYSYLSSSSWVADFMTTDTTTSSFVVGNLAPGTYYYRVTTTYGTYDIRYKSSPFTIKPGATTNVYVKLLY